MNDQTDQQLLHEYATRRSDTAFAELVRRHIDLVHSAAQRMLGSPNAASDVTQATFVALAQQAPQLDDRPALSGWLHTTARNLAVKTIRTDARRRVREQEAVAMNELLTSTPDAAWEQIAPHLDAALGELNEADRDALLLRYFEKKSAAEIGCTLGISSEAAQKRVSRAVERLREFFAKRGVTVGAGGLVVVISANAVQAAPVGLAVTISAAALAGAAATTSTIIAATTKTIAMTTLQKTLVTATVAVLAGAGIYEARQAAQLRDQVQTLQQQQAPLTEQIQKLENSFADVTNRLAGLLAENTRLKSNPERNELLKLRGEVGVLRSQISPELQKEKLSMQAEFTRDEGQRISRASLFMTELIGNAYGAGKGKLPVSFTQFTNTAAVGIHGGSLFEQVLIPELERFDFFNFGTDIFIHDARGVTLNPEFKHRLVVCREKQPRQGLDGIWHRIYGVVDLGDNLLIATSYDGNFDAWEKQNVIFTPPIPK